MSKTNDKVVRMLASLKNDLQLDFDDMYDSDIDEIIGFIEDEEGIDLEDSMSDFDKEDQMEYFRDNIAAGVIWIECSDINAEADLKELLEEFKQKHILTKITF